jgi:hypothetical protein
MAGWCDIIDINEELRLLSVVVIIIHSQEARIGTSVLLLSQEKLKAMQKH